MKIIFVAMTIAAMTTLVGCDTSNARKVDARMGHSVASMIEAQTYDPSAAAHPPALAPEGANGQRVENAVEIYHKDVAGKEEKVSRTIVFDVGNK